MKYRMKETRWGGFDLMLGCMKCVSPQDRHDALVEFWQEIERLRAERDELLATCEEMVPAIDGLSKFAAAHEVWDARRDAGKIIERAQVAIARAEQHHNQETQT